MSNQMTTPINTIPVDNNVQPNNDIQDPLVQEILSDMVKSSDKHMASIQSEQPVQINTMQPVYNYPVQNEGFLAQFYDKKIMILTLLIIIVVVVFHLQQFEDFMTSIQNNYVQEYKFYIKYAALYLVLYCLQKYGVLS